MVYDKLELTDTYGSGHIMEDKSVKHREQIARELWQMLKSSPYTFGELLECLGWEKWRLDRILSGDEEIGLYELTHITGALGKEFKVTFNNKV